SGVRLSFTVQGNGPFISVQDGAPAWVTPFIQHCGDDYSGRGPAASYRFWASGRSVLLAPGDQYWDIPLTSDNWTNVFGQHDPDGFAGTLGALCAVGVTFGNPSAGATGHGAYSVGPANFVVTGLAL